MRIFGWQHNKEFNDAVNFWRGKLLAAKTPQNVYEYPPKSGGFPFPGPSNTGICGIVGGKPRTGQFGAEISPAHQTQGHSATRAGACFLQPCRHRDGQGHTSGPGHTQQSAFRLSINDARIWE